MSRRDVIADPFKFAIEGRSLSRRVALADLLRLVDILAETDGEIEFSVSGEVGPERQPRLRLAAAGLLRLRCQRCLGAMDWPLKIESVLQLVRPGTPIPDDELEIDEFDAIEAIADMDVLALVEDEIVLAAPIAPRHVNCEAPLALGGVDEKSPFAALGNLKKIGGAG